MSARMSAAVAPPRFTMKFACLDEISALLIRLPLSPRFSNQRREAHARPGDRFLAVKLRAPEATLEPQDDAADATVLDQHVVTAADHRDRQLLALGEHERVADVVHILRHDEDVGAAADAERGVEAQGLLEPHFPPDLS